MQIDVIQDDIVKGSPGRSVTCPVARGFVRALRTIYPLSDYVIEPWVGYFHTEQDNSSYMVANALIRHYDGSYHTDVRILVSDEVTKWIESYDNHEEVSPFSFEMELDDKTKRRVII